MNGGTSALPFLRAALLRHLQDFPSVRNGLSLTEQMALEVLSEGPRRAQHLFCAVADSEAAPWMGDAMFYAEIERLRQGACPLMAAKSAGPIEHRTELEITAHGRDVSAGRADAVALNGVDRWIGGVHLNGHQVWRWDEQAQALIQ
jgi:hypothetical protein